MFCLFHNLLVIWVAWCVRTVQAQPPTLAPTFADTCSVQTALDGSFTGPECAEGFCRPGHQIALQSPHANPFVFLCVPCSPGAYSEIPGSPCLPCEPGTFTNISGSISCLPCPRGEYADQSNAQLCRTCSAGSVLDRAAAATSCRECEPGEFSGGAGATDCGICSPGTISGKGATSCTNCSAGSFQDQPGGGGCKQCVPGTYSQEGAWNCTRCPVGMYSGKAATGCTNCSAGTANDEEGKDDCEECSWGWYAPFEGSSKCIQCPAGTYNPFRGAKKCIPCPESYFTNKEGATECEMAPDRYTTLGNSSTDVVCDIGYYEESTNGTRACRACSSGMICTEKNVQLKTLSLKPGYWRVSQESSKVYECQWEGCAGGALSDERGADALCAEGYSGPECQVCAVGFYENLYAGSCSFCADSSISTGMLAFLIVLAVVCIGGFSYAANRGMKLRVKMGMVLRMAGNTIGQQNEGAASKVDTGRWSALTAKVCCPSVGTGLFQRIAVSMRTKVKILFVTFQIVSGFENNINVVMPVNYLGFLNVLSFLNFEIKSILPIQCWIPSDRCVVNYFGEIVIITVAPILLCLVLCLCYLVVRWYHFARARDGGKRDAAINHAYVFCFRVFIAITYIVFPPVSSKLFAAFKYVYYNDSSAGVYNQCYVETAMCVSCSDEYYLGVIVPYVLCMILVYPVGVPLMYLVLLYRQREEIASRPLYLLSNGKAMNKYLSERSLKQLAGGARAGGGSGSGKGRSKSDSRRDSRDSSNNLRVVVSTRESHRRRPRDDAVEMGSPPAAPGVSDSSAAERMENPPLASSGGRREGARRGASGSASDDGCSSEEETQHAPLSSETRALSLLYALYLPSCMYFELFECIRRLALSGLMVFYLPGSPFQCVIGIMICVLALRIYAAYQPFLEKPNSVIAEMCQWQIFFTLFVFLLIKSNTVPSNATVGVMLLLLNIGLPMAGITIALSDAAYEMHDHRKFKKEQDDRERRRSLDSGHSGEVCAAEENTRDSCDGRPVGEVGSMVREMSTVNEERGDFSPPPRNVNEEEEKQDSRTDLAAMLDEPLSAPLSGALTSRSSCSDVSDSSAAASSRRHKAAQVVPTV